MKKKTLSLLIALVLVMSCVVGGTLAWLSDSTGDVVNTFTIGKVKIELDEHKLGADGELIETETTEANDNYKIVPGTTQPKDPFVTLENGSEACFVFVEVKEDNNTTNGKTIVTWNIDDTVWTNLNVSGKNVYYKVCDAATKAETLNVLKDEKVTYSDQLETDDLKNITEQTQPKLTFKAYAIQQAGFITEGNTEAQNALAAWNEVSA